MPFILSHSLNLLLLLFIFGFGFWLTTGYEFHLQTYFTLFPQPATFISQQIKVSLHSKDFKSSSIRHVLLLFMSKSVLTFTP